MCFQDKQNRPSFPIPNLHELNEHAGKKAWLNKRKQMYFLKKFASDWENKIHFLTYNKENMP